MITRERGWVVVFISVGRGLLRLSAWIATTISEV